VTASWTLDPHLTSCGWCAHWQVACATPEEKQAVEERHRAKFHAGAPVNVSDVRDRMLGEHPDDRDLIVSAIRRAVAADPDGLVDANSVRPHVAGEVLPQMIGATFGALVAQGRLVFVTFTRNEDKASRNGNKPLQRYRWVEPEGAA